jgi:hypothetical protein
LTLLAPPHRGTFPGYDTGGVTVQLQLNKGGAGFSHNAFGNECDITLDRVDEEEAAGSLRCSFGDLNIAGSFSAEGLPRS